MRAKAKLKPFKKTGALQTRRVVIPSRLGLVFHVLLEMESALGCQTSSCVLGRGLFWFLHACPKMLLSPPLFNISKPGALPRDKNPA